ncbi:MAG: carboxypeptidase-like regulatory domain-containing protein, partial [Bacteroidaceae bacterium]|nr:carboxypeptidase-like regulatory domain-containing protein [Bacteroidaceae bacterium]
MNKHIKAILLWAALFFTLPMSAQISRISGTVSDEFGGIPGIQVKEIDTNNRIVSSAITDANGNYTMVVKNQKNKIVFHGVGYTDQTRTITKSVIHVNMKEAVKYMKEAVVTAKKMSPVAGLSIPEREYGGAVSSMKMDDLEGLAFESV